VSASGPAVYTSSYSSECSGTIAAGEQKTCTVTFDDQPPRATLYVITDVVNDDGGTAVAGDFGLGVTGGNPVPASFPGAEAPGTTVMLDPGSYSVSASGPAVYTSSYSSECSGTIAAGEQKTCTVTLDDRPATLLVITNVVNDDGGTLGPSDFTMTATGGNPSPASFPGEGPPGRQVTLDPGAYGTGITFPGGRYVATSSSPDCAGAIAAGETKTCTWTVDDVPARGALHVITNVVNDNGGTASASDWTMNVTGGNPVPASFPGAGAPGTTVTLDPGSYSVSASGPAGYTSALSTDCSGTIANREAKTCTVTLDDQPAHGTLFVITNVVNDDGGSAVAGNFTMFVTGTNPSPASFPGEGPPGREVTLDPGSYGVGVPDLLGYVESLSPDCSGTIAAGEQKTCTVTVDDPPTRGTLFVITNVVNDDSGTASASDWTMTVTGSNPVPGRFPGTGAPGTTVTLDPGSYSVSGSGPAGYTSSLSSECSGTIAAGEEKTCTMTADDEPPAAPICDGKPATIVGTAGPSEIRGTSGDDVIVDLDGDNIVRGRGGNDTICTGPGNDEIISGGGADTIIDTGGQNDVQTGAGNDSVRTSDGADTINAGGGVDTIVDTRGDNTVEGGAGHDSISTGGGNDTIDAGAGNDTVDAGDGNNTVNGQGGDDTITTGAGDDRIDGGLGFDTCSPGSGNNMVRRCEA
jgi:Ca2+-binding RTX toxin-like protein